jgi:hypothetical protein
MFLRIERHRVEPGIAGDDELGTLCQQDE